MEVIDKYIDKEISAGRVCEITGNLPSSFFCSPLGLTPKKRDGEQTGWRMIFDLSCPHGQSVNDGIPQEFGTLQYESFQHALQLVAQAGPNCLLLKKDLKTAFRQVGISPLDWHLFIFSWRGEYYIDMFLAFGLRPTHITSYLQLVRRRHPLDPRSLVQLNSFPLRRRLPWDIPGWY